MASLLPVDAGPAALGAVFAHPRVSALERTWRSIRMLVEQASEHALVEIVNASASDLDADFDDAPELAKSGMWRLVHQYNPPGGAPFTLPTPPPSTPAASEELRHSRARVVRMMRWCIAVVGAVLLGCTGTASDGANCGQPAQVEYTCPQAAPDAGACARIGGANDVSPANASFAIDCMVTLTSCNSSYGVPQTCDCQVSSFAVDGGSVWVCPD